MNVCPKIQHVYRMRNATILVLRLKGVATETIKNIVLAGIGKLVVVDTDDVSAEDLGAGFFFRDEDVGKKVSVARSYFVKCLSPLGAPDEREMPLRWPVPPLSPYTMNEVGLNGCVQLNSSPTI